MHAEAARRAAADAAERTAAEEARRLAEEEAEVRRLAERAAALTRHRTEAEEVFVDDFLAADDWFDAWDNAQRVSRDDFDYWKAEFVQAWARRVLKEDKLDLEQARAVASTSQDLRLVARAGSGKTRTIVTRALFLQLHCGVEPGSIMLVAFNRNAVAEISRVHAALPYERPHAAYCHFPRTGLRTPAA